MSTQVAAIIAMVTVLVAIFAIPALAANYANPSQGFTGECSGIYTFTAKWNDNVGAFIADIQMGGPHTGIVDTGSPYLQVFDTYPCPPSVKCTSPLGSNTHQFADGTNADETFVRVLSGAVTIGGALVPPSSVVGATKGHGPGSLGQIGTVGLGSLAENRNTTPQTNWSWFDSIGGKTLAVETQETVAKVSICPDGDWCPFAPDSTTMTFTQAQLNALGVSQGTNLIVVPAASAAIPDLKYLAIDVGAYYTPPSPEVAGHHNFRGSRFRSGHGQLCAAPLGISPRRVRPYRNQRSAGSLAVPPAGKRAPPPERGPGQQAGGDPRPEVPGRENVRQVPVPQIRVDPDPPFPCLLRRGLR